MPRFHAGFSIGTVAGALVGAVMVALHVSVTAHLLAVAVVVAVVVPFAVRSFVPDVEPTDDRAIRPRPAARRAPRSSRRRGQCAAAWLEPRTLLIGLVVLAFAFAEGAGNDWISVALIDGYQQPAAVGTLGFAVFLAAMTAGRWFGPGLLDRYGRVVVVRSSALVGHRRGAAVRVRARPAAGVRRRRCCGAWAPRSASRSA